MCNKYFSISKKFIMPDPPTNPYSNAVPFLIVIGLTAAKQAYEDIMRHKADYEVNGKKVRVIRKGKFQTIESRRIKVLDLK